MADYYQFQDQVWPYTDPWDEDRREIRNYLKRIWLKNNHSTTETVATTRWNVEREKDQILQWWWSYRYSIDPIMILNDYFGSYLKREFDNSKKFAEDDNIVDEPRSVTVRFEPTRTKNYIQ